MHPSDTDPVMGVALAMIAGALCWLASAAVFALAIH